MIGYLKGSISVKTPTYVYIECAGVGYHVNISLSTFSKLEDKKDALIYTYMAVREDDISLYGFIDQDERQLFTLLISVSGIGCNTARVILSYMTTDELKRAIIQEDEVSIGKVKGVGPKTVKKIIIELKDKVIKTSGGDMGQLGKAITHTLKDEALAALVALGFQKAIVDKQINNVLKNSTSIDNVEDLIKNVLKQMN